MANVTLTVDGRTFEFNEGDVDRVTETISAKPEQTEVSGTASMGAYVYDYDGVLKTIKIEGYLTTAATTRITGHTITSILHQKQWLESLLNGNQQSITFTSTYASTSSVSTAGSTPPYNTSFTNTTCACETVNFIENSGDPSRLKFEMTFLVGVL